MPKQAPVQFGKYFRLISDQVSHFLNYSCSTIKIGHFGMKQSEILDNYEAAVPQLVAHAARDWSFVNIVGLKSKKSPLLPIIYQALKGFPVVCLLCHEVLRCAK